MTLRLRSIGVLVCLTLALPALNDWWFSAVEAQAPVAVDRSLLTAYRWRSIGPNRGGRSIAVAGVKGRPREAYFGATGGGLWKTVDAGNNWFPVTDGHVASSSVGAVAVSESQPDVVYIGMGESCIRGNIMPGDGVYKSTDAGKTWTHVGFRNVDAISKIRIHPTNPDVAFVAAFGQYYGPSDERGVFKTTDGGKTWRRVLFRDARTGAVDLAIDRTNPNVLFAALWEAYRIEYQMSSGGPGSGLFKSTDGGETWTEITRNPGLPSGVVGRIGVALTAADSNRVYALIENAAGGLYVSDDAGGSWKLMNDSRTVRQRAFYYTHVHADQRNKDLVYLLNTAMFRSTDAGKTLVSVGQGTHGDFHDLWTDPDDSEHLVIANDGGGAITFNVGQAQRSYSDQDFPTAQWYHVVTTAHLPFHVCGSQQDNSTLCVASNTNAAGGGFGGVPPLPPYQVGGGEPGYIAPDRTNTDLFFAGSNNGTFLTRYNHRTGELKEVGAYPRFFSGEPSKDVKERWQWTYPIIFSYVDPNVLYTSSQRVWRTTDGGQNWEAISGDLSRHDPKTMDVSGGPITHDMNSPEIYGTVFSLAPGKKTADLLWAGSDDGLIHVTRDHGKTWTNITPPDMPEFGRVSQIDGSAFDDATAYVAVKKMLLGDRSPYIFRTRDYGKSWTKIVNGIPANDYVHVVREDPVRRGLLYAGTQHGVYISLDDGANWLPFNEGLPKSVPVTDLVVERNSIAIGTHGRSFYVMDDIAALRQFGVTTAADVQLFKPADVIRGLERAGISYQLKTQPKALALEFLDAKGELMRRIEGRPPQPANQSPAAPQGGGGFGQGPPAATMTAGLNRFTWDLNSTPVVSFPGMILWGATQNGPMVLPGSYTVRLTADGVTQTQTFNVVKHPLRQVSDADLQFQWDLASRIRDKVNEANLSVIKIRRIKNDITTRTKDAPKEVQDAGAKLTQSLAEIEEEIYQVRNQSGQDPLNFPIKTNNRLASLLRVAVSGEGRPTSSVEPIFNDLTQELKGHTDRLDKTLANDLAAFNRMLTRIKREPIIDK
jgi:photosystem II stability/assembly factor-like uncharacterized protein